MISRDIRFLLFFFFFSICLPLSRVCSLEDQSIQLDSFCLCFSLYTLKFIWQIYIWEKEHFSGLQRILVVLLELIPCWKIQYNIVCFLNILKFWWFFFYFISLICQTVCVCSLRRNFKTFKLCINSPYSIFRVTVQFKLDLCFQTP